MPYNGGLDLQFHWFSNGGCVIHKMWVKGYVGHFSAWFDADGNLLDAEQRISIMKHRTVRHGKPCWKAIERKGRLFIESRKVTDGPKCVSEGDR